MTGVTPGQAFHASLTSAQAGRYPGYEAAPWDDLEDTFRADLEAAAKAAARIAQPVELRAGLAKRAGEWDEQAAVHDRDAGKTRDSIKIAVLLAKSRVYASLAAEIREIAGEAG